LQCAACRVKFAAAEASPEAVDKTASMAAHNEWALHARQPTRQTAWAASPAAGFEVAAAAACAGKSAGEFAQIVAEASLHLLF